MEQYIQHVWERRAVAALWRETALDSFKAKPCRVTYLELRDAICEFEKEAALLDVLRRSPGRGRIAPIERGMS